MVCVVQDEGDSKRFDLLWCQPFDRSLGCDRHKGWQHCDAILKMGSSGVDLQEAEVTHERASCDKHEHSSYDTVQ